MVRVANRVSMISLDMGHEPKNRLKMCGSLAIVRRYGIVRNETRSGKTSCQSAIGGMAHIGETVFEPQIRRTLRNGVPVRLDAPEGFWGRRDTSCPEPNYPTT